MVTVYLSNKYIRIAIGEESGGRVRVSKVYTVSNTRGCVLNGTITDEDEFVALISKVWEEQHFPKNDVYLVLDSTQFTTKVFDAPMQKPKLMFPYVEREFAGVGRIADPIYAYFYLNSEEKGKGVLAPVFGGAVSKEYILKYKQAFAKVGITITGVNSSIAVMVRMAETFGKYHKGGSILQFVDDITLISVILVDGKYQYFSRNRLFSEPGTDQYTMEAATAANNLLQFAKTQDFAAPIEEIHTIGLESEQMDAYIELLQASDEDISVKRMGVDSQISLPSDVEEDEASCYALAVAGLMKPDLKTNFITTAVESEKGPKKENKYKKYMIPIAIIAGILLIAAAALGGRYFYLSSQLKEVQAYNERSDVQQACDEYDVLSSALSTEASLQSSLVNLRSNVLAYPRVDSATEAVVASCASGLVSAEISSYNSTTGILSFNTTAANVEQIHQFIGLLSGQPIFASVDYTGYTQDSSGQWNVRVNCMMAQRQEATE